MSGWWCPSPTSQEQYSEYFVESDHNTLIDVWFLLLLAYDGRDGLRAATYACQIAHGDSTCALLSCVDTPAHARGMALDVAYAALDATFGIATKIKPSPA